MRITYDAKADAAYVYLADVVNKPETHVVTDDVYLDFDEHGRLVGVEVLDASKHLDLSYLEPLLERLNELSVCWYRLRNELVSWQRTGQPIKTLDKGVKNWIEEVTDDRVVLKSEDPRSRGPRPPITRKMLEIGDTQWHKKNRRLAVVRALWDLGGYPFPLETRNK